jgi:transcriptional regulator with XRE-family HTH domain
VLRIARLGAGISQVKLAERAGLARNYPGLMERGVRQPTIGVLIRLSEALGVDPAILVRMTVGRLRREAQTYENRAHPGGVEESRQVVGRDTTVLELSTAISFARPPPVPPGCRLNGERRSWGAAKCLKLAEREGLLGAVRLAPSGPPSGC